MAIALAELSKGHITKTEAKHVVTWTDTEPITIEACESAITTRRLRSKSTIKPKYLCYIPIGIDLSPTARSTLKIECGTDRAHVSSSAYVIDKYKELSQHHKVIKEYESLISTRNIWQHPKAVYRYEVYATSLRNAWLKFAEYYDLATGLLEFSCAFGFITMHFGQGPTGQIGKGDHVIITDGDEDTELIRLSQLREATSREPPARIAKFNKRPSLENFRFINSKLHNWRDTHSIDNLIARSLMLYGDSADTVNNKDKLLHYWQMAEQITCAKSKKGNPEYVSKALAWMSYVPGTPDGTLELALTSAGNARNTSVHENRQADATHDLADILKYSCQRALKWLLLNYESIGSKKTLTMILEHHHNTKTSILNRHSGLEILLKEQQKRTDSDEWWRGTDIYRRKDWRL